MKKLFQFSGTINGLNYFLRNVMFYFFGFMGGYMVGYGISDSNNGLTTFGFLVAALAIWGGITTIYKRMSALFNEDASMYTVGLVLLQVLSSFTKGSTFEPLLTLGLLIIGLYLIFKNSNIQNHEG